jgi:hypothetical protein
MLLEDSGFENSWFAVAAFRKPAGVTLSSEYEFFNNAMKGMCVISKHMRLEV